MYYFTIESQDVGRRTNLTLPYYFLTKSYKDTSFPLNPLNVRARADVPGITISWENPPDPDFSYIRIMRHEDRFHGNPFLGKLIYEGTEESFLDTDVVAGKKYFYSLFARNIHGDFSSGVAVSATAFSKKVIFPPQEIKTKIDEIFTPPIVSEISEDLTFFVHQHNQKVEILNNKKVISIDGNMATIVDTSSKTLSDDWMKVTNRSGEVVGEYLFLFNKDSLHYQSVIPPLQKDGNYDIKIYRYKDNIPMVIAEGRLNVKTGIITPIEPLPNKLYNCLFFYLILVLILLFLLKHREKNQEK
jgi:hypothetical protein